MKKIGEIADKIYNYQIVNIDNNQLFVGDKDIDFTHQKLLELRIKNLALKNGMPINLDQHIHKFIGFPADYQSIKEELVKKVGGMIKSKKEMGLMIEPALAALLYSYNPSEFPLAPFSALENMVAKIEDVESITNYDTNFKPENSIDFLLNPNNRDRIYPILLANDENRNELLTMMQSFVLYKPDHRLREQFVKKCEKLNEPALRFMHKKIIELETQLAKESTKSLKRPSGDKGSHAEQILNERNKKAKNSEKG